jgi:hypothetical protein
MLIRICVFRTISMIPRPELVTRYVLRQQVSGCGTLMEFVNLNTSSRKVTRYKTLDFRSLEFSVLGICMNTFDYLVSPSPVSPSGHPPLRPSHEVRRVFYLPPPRLRRERISHCISVRDQLSRHQNSTHCAHLLRLVEEALLPMVP